MEIIEILVFAFYTYLLLGFIFGLWFVFKGVQKVDGGMAKARWGLRLLLLPGTVALWPILWRKYLKA